MSGSGSTVHIGQDPASTYQADGRFTPKTDDGATIVVGDLDTNIGAEWGNTVDDQFWKLNQIFQADDFADALALGAAKIGSNVLSVTGTTETTGNVTVGGNLIVSGGTALPTLDVSSPSGRPGVAAFGGRVDVEGFLQVADDEIRVTDPGGSQVALDAEGGGYHWSILQRAPTNERVIAQKSSGLEPIELFKRCLFNSSIDVTGTAVFNNTLDVTGATTLSGGLSLDAQTLMTVGVYTDAQRPAAGTAGRVIFNTTDGNLNIDDGTNWILPDGTTT